MAAAGCWPRDPVIESMGDRVGEHETSLTHTVDRPVRVQGRVALVGGDFIMDHALLVTPAPHGQDDSAFPPRRSRRRQRHLTVADPIRPFGIQSERAQPPHPVEFCGHRQPAATSLNAMLPSRNGRVEPPQILHLEFADRVVAQLVAQLAAVLELIDPVCLRPHGSADAIALHSCPGSHSRAAPPATSTSSSPCRSAQPPLAW